METTADFGPQGTAASGIEALLPAILDTVAQPVWVVDSTGAISFANPAALEELGYPTLAALRGKPSRVISDGGGHDGASQLRSASS